jgi:hypothetical protein
MRSRDSMLPRILEAVDKYVHGSITLLEFEEWFIPAAWNISGQVGNQAPVEALAGEIWLRIAEHDRGHLPEDEMRKLLGEAADRAKTASALS